MLHLNVHLRFYFREYLKLYKNLGKKDAFYAALNDPLDSAIKGST